MSSKRWTANQARPKRYRPGKGEDVPSDEDDYSDEEEEVQEPARPVRPAPSATSFPRAAIPAKQIASVTLKEQPVINEDEFETESEGETAPVKPKPAGETDEPAEQSTQEEGSSDEEEEESSSEDEAPRKLLRPTFIRKDQRQSKDVGGGSQILSAQSKAEDPEEIARRKAAADALVQEQLDKQAAARAAGKKYWDDDDGNLYDEIDDTDGIEPEAELAAWKLRELKRVKRARDAIEEAEKEREEIERRRNLTAEEREKEDKEHMEAQKADRDGKAQTGYMKKYFHKGAFFQDDEVAEELRARDLMGAKFADETNRELLPEYMQIRDMTKLGKKGRTRYKDLRSEDTGRWGDDLGTKRQRWTGDERFAPDNERGGSGPQRSGANAAPVAERIKRPDNGRITKGQVGRDMTPDLREGIALGPEMAHIGEDPGARSIAAATSDDEWKLDEHILTLAVSTY